jgi:hypothetical protein
MAIPRQTPFTVPPTPEKTFDSVWIKNINIHCPQINQAGNTDGHITLELAPYDSSEGSESIYISSDTEGIETLTVPNPPYANKSFWDAVNEVPEVGAAMGAIVAAVAPLRAWIEEQQQEFLDQQEESSE